MGLGVVLAGGLAGWWVWSETGSALFALLAGAVIAVIARLVVSGLAGDLTLGWDSSDDGSCNGGDSGGD
jgi:hypothetical protein